MELQELLESLKDEDLDNLKALWNREVVSFPKFRGEI